MLLAKIGVTPPVTPWLAGVAGVTCGFGRGRTPGHMVLHDAS